MNHEKNKRSIKDTISNKLAIYAAGSIIMAMGVTSVGCTHPYNLRLENGTSMCYLSYCVEYETVKRCEIEYDNTQCYGKSLVERWNTQCQEIKQVCKDVKECKKHDEELVSIEKCLL
mgnify:FL=1